MTLYTVRAERTAKWWVLQSVDCPGAISQVARLDQADAIREAIAFVTGSAIDDIEIHLEIQLGRELETALAEFAASRERADQEAHLVADSSRRLVAELVGRGMSYRDIGTMLGLSHQRVGQLAADAKHALVDAG